MTTITEARAKLRQARTLHAETLTTADREAWKREVELFRQLEESLTERLNSRAIRPVSQLSLEAR